MNGRQRAAHPSRVKVTGPLGRYADGFRQHLAERAYHPQVIGRQALLMADLSTWLEARVLGEDALTPEAAGDFVRDRRASGHRELASFRALGPLLGYLRGLGVVPSVAEQAPRTPAEALLAEFAGYLTQERGLSAMSVNSYVRHARPFVTGLGSPLADTLAGLSAADVTGFVTSHHPQWGRGTAQATVTALRSLLRFLHAAGHVPEPLAGAVPPVAHWQLTALPAGVSPEHVAALLAGCDRRSASGRRDYAILMLLSRLGLRAGEAAAAELGDVDWEAGEIAVRGKGRRTETLPLPADVGEALADYVQHARPRCAGRPLLVILHAPYTGLTRAHVLAAVYRA
jgi:site-specific recombinase XerD